MPSDTIYKNRQNFWHDHVQACQRSGSSKASYCRDNDLTYHRFIYWHTKLAAEPAPPQKAMVVPGVSKLVPVVFSEPDPSTDLQVHLPNGVYISGITAHSVEVVGRLIDLL